jgi:hypothetical protein
MATAILPALTAASALRQSPIPALRRLVLEESQEAVVIYGHLPSYYLKQLAQETVMPTLGGRELRNRIVVVRAQQVALAD